MCDWVADLISSILALPNIFLYLFLQPVVDDDDKEQPQHHISNVAVDVVEGANVRPPVSAKRVSTGKVVVAQVLVASLLEDLKVQG